MAATLFRGLSVLITAVVLIAVLPNLTLSTASAANSLHYLFGSGAATGGKTITLRVELTEPAESNGRRVALASDDPSVPLASSIKVPAGQTEHSFSVTTKPVASDTDVTVTARVGAVIRSRTVTIKAPELSELSVQSRIRAGGLGKITVRLSGRAPAGGVSIDLNSNRPSIFDPASAVTIAGGASSVSLNVPAADVAEDVAVRVTARLDDRTLTEDTIVRNYSDPIDPTPTASPSPTEAVATETSTATMTATVAPSVTAELTATPTDTVAPVDRITFEVTSGSSILVKGSTVTFRICLTSSQATQVFASFSSNNLSVALDEDIAPSQWTISAGATGNALCTSIAMTGRTTGPEQLGIGEVNLKTNVEGVDYLSQVITFTAPAATATESAAQTSTPTEESTSTTTPVASPTETASATSTAIAPPTATGIPTSTATLESTASATSTPEPTATDTPTVEVPQDSVSISLASGSATVFRGETVVFEVCLTQDSATSRFLSISSSDGVVVRDEDISPTSLVLGPGQVGPDLCAPVSMIGRTDGARGIGDVRLKVYLDQFYLSELITFIEPPATATPTETPEPTSTSTEPATQTPTASPTETSVPTATKTNTAVPTSTATETPTPTSTATDTPVATATETETPVPTATASNTPIPTATTPADPLVITLTSGSDTVAHGSTVAFSVCLSASEPQARFVSYRSNNEIVVLSDSINPPNDVFGPGDCLNVSMTGRTTGPGSPGVGEVQLVANMNGADYLGPVITFLGP